MRFAVVVAVAVLATAFGGWVGALLGGWSGLVWSCCVLLAWIALLGRARLGGPLERPRRGAAPAIRPGQYARYDELAKLARMALRDGRYFANVLAPELRQLASRLAAHRRRGGAESPLADLLGDRAWQLLSVERGGRERDDPPSEAQLALILTALERL
jgi:hypothetical protein